MTEAEDLVLRGYPAYARAAAPPPPWEPRISCSSSCSFAARSQSRLHNFSFPSTSWGSHRLLRCAKVDPRGVSPSADRVSAAERGPPGRQRTGASPPPGRAAKAPTRWERAEEESCGRDEADDGGDERLEKFRDAMMTEFQKAADWISLPQPVGSLREESKEDLGSSLPSAGEEALRPWNLRLRRAAACSAPSTALENVARRAKYQGQSLTVPEKSSAAANYLGRMRRWVAGLECEERPKFSPVLSKDEIEEDFLLMTGSKPPRRPQKRPRNVQKQIEVLCPGFHLTEITPDLYKTS